MRHELKYYIGYAQYEIIRSRIRPLLNLDEHSRLGGYDIRSLYFDDIEETGLFDKLAGIKEREKFRIRIYNGSDSFIRLEKKLKVGDLVEKKDIKLSRSQANQILRGERLDYDDDLYREFWIKSSIKHLKPKVIVDYFREAYVHPLEDVRITFDMRLRTGNHNLDIFDFELPTIDVLEENKLILEIKYNSYLPSFIKNLIQVNAHNRLAISKYVMCRKYNKKESWEDN